MLFRSIEPEFRGVIAISALVTAFFVVLPAPLLTPAQGAAAALFP